MDPDGQELTRMYIVGEEEIEAIAQVIRSGKLFRYGEEGQCATVREAIRRLSRRRSFRSFGQRHFRADGGFDRDGHRPRRRSHHSGPHLYGDRDGRSGGWRHSGDRRRRREHHDLAQGHSRGDRAAYEGDHPRPYVGRDLRHGRDHGRRPRTQSPGSRRLLPGRGRLLQRAEARLDRTRRRFQLQLLQEHHQRRRRRPRHQRPETRRKGALRDRSLRISTGRARTTAFSRSPATAPGLRRSWARC